MWQCHYCRSTLPRDIQQRNRLCPNCGSDLHCCRNCIHYDENLSSKCKEPGTEWVGDTSARNDCAFFEMKPLPKNTGPDESAIEKLNEAERAKEAFRNLFR